MTSLGPADWDRRYAATESMWSAEANEFVVHYLSDLPAGSMLDIAGGEGRNALWFARRGWDVENIDFSQVALNKFLARAQVEGLSARCTATCVDAAQEPRYALSPADLAIMVYLQIPATDLRNAIVSAVQQLSPGGTFFGVWHARENLADGFGGPQSAEVLPTQDELRSAAEKAGLREIFITLANRHVTVENIDHTAIDVILTAKR